MPIVSCSSCRSRFKVRIEAMGKVMKCPKCKADFKAIALHAAPRKSHGLPPVAYAGIAAGALLLAFLLVKMAGSDEDSKAAGAGRDPTKVSVEAGRQSDAATDSTDVAPLPRKQPRDLIAERARDILELIRAADENRLATLHLDFSRMHEDRRQQGLETELWLDLDQIAQFAKKEEYMADVLGDASLRDVTRRSVVLSVEPISLKQGSATVVAVLKDPLEESQQEVTLHFEALAGSWRVYRVDRNDSSRGDADGQSPVDAATAGPGATTALRRNPLGEPHEVEPLPDTSALLASKIERQIDTLIDPEQTVGSGRARRELVEIGKPAIPFLLNRLVPLDLEEPEDLLQAGQISQTLQDITGEEYAITRGMRDETMTGAGLKDNDKSRRLWFGWWRDNHATFNSRPEPQHEDPSDGE